MKYLLRFLLGLILLIGGETAHAQDLLKAKDLSSVKVDLLSDADIVKIKNQLNDSKLSIDQAGEILMAKGMSSVEFSKLKQRLNTEIPQGQAKNKLKNESSQKKSIDKLNNATDSLDSQKYSESRPVSLINPLIFGSELYTSNSPAFEANLKLATPLNYILGPDDELSLYIYGVQEYSAELLISAEGDIIVPNVGKIKVAGMTIEAATQKINNILSNSAYPYLKNGGSKLSVTLSKIRSIKVTIIGAYRPANYTLSSLATVFNALYLAGGPNEFGSFREIELLRNNKVIRKIDLYRMILKGDQSDNIALKDNDVIRIPSYKTRVEIQGQVKRPGIFEVLPNETFNDILEFASGFTDTAYSAVVKIFQKSEKERKVKDLQIKDFGVYKPSSGDIFVVSKILNRFQNRVQINGAVFRPDFYELSDGLTISELIAKADGLKEDAFMGRGQIFRLQDDLTRSISSFDIRKALAKDQEHDIKLRREDEVLISSILDLRDSFKITVQGEVRVPGEYNFVEGLTLRDIILLAGGFTDAAYKNIEIARLIKRDSITLTDNRASAIINTEIDGDLSLSVSSMILRPFDVITVRKKSGYIRPESVIITGQIQYPGPYALSNRNERISDVLRRAGGFTPDAFPEGAYLKRILTEEEKKKKETAKDIQSGLTDNDSITIKRLDKQIQQEYQKIPIDLVEILKSPGSIEDIVLRSNDELIIPKFDAQVKISGAVLLETQVPFRSKNSFKDYISDAGGYNADAWKRRAYVVYANGRASSTKKILFFKKYPQILPGSEIIIPKKSDKKKMTAGEIIGLSSALASLAVAITAILR